MLQLVKCLMHKDEGRPELGIPSTQIKARHGSRDQESLGLRGQPSLSESVSSRVSETLSQKIRCRA